MGKPYTSHRRLLLILPLLFGIIPFLGVSSRAQSYMPPPDRQLRMFLLGYGAKEFVSWFSHQALEDKELKAALEKKVPEHWLKGKEDKEKGEILARSLTTGILASLSIFLKKMLHNYGFTDPAARALTGAFAAGEKFPLLMKFLQYSWRAVGLTAWDLLQQTGYATLSNARKALDDFLKVANAGASAATVEELWNNFLTAQEVPYYSDLAYPIRSHHGTMLDCGPSEKYCLSKQEKAAYDETIKNLEVNPDAIALDLARLVSRAGAISVGIGFAIISYEIGSVLAHFAAIDLLGALGGSESFGLIIEKTLNRYGDLTLLNQLNKWVRNELQNNAGQGVLTLVNPEDMENALTAGELGRIAQVAIWPEEKKFLLALLGRE